MQVLRRRLRRSCVMRRTGASSFDRGRGCRNGTGGSGYSTRSARRSGSDQPRARCCCGLCGLVLASRRSGRRRFRERKTRLCRGRRCLYGVCSGWTHGRRRVRARRCRWSLQNRVASCSVRQAFDAQTCKANSKLRRSYLAWCCGTVAGILLRDGDLAQLVL